MSLKRGDWYNISMNRKIIIICGVVLLIIGIAVLFIDSNFTISNGISSADTIHNCITTIGRGSRQVFLTDGDCKTHRLLNGASLALSLFGIVVMVAGTQAKVTKK